MTESPQHRPSLSLYHLPSDVLGVVVQRLAPELTGELTGHRRWLATASVQHHVSAITFEKETLEALLRALPTTALPELAAHIKHGLTQFDYLVYHELRRPRVAASRPAAGTGDAVPRHLPLPRHAEADKVRALWLTPPRTRHTEHVYEQAWSGRALLYGDVLHPYTGLRSLRIEDVVVGDLFAVSAPVGLTCVALHRCELTHELVCRLGQLPALSILSLLGCSLPPKERAADPLSETAPLGFRALRHLHIATARKVWECVVRAAAGVFARLQTLSVDVAALDDTESTPLFGTLAVPSMRTLKSLELLKIAYLPAALLAWLTELPALQSLFLSVPTAIDGSPTWYAPPDALPEHAFINLRVFDMRGPVARGDDLWRGVKLPASVFPGEWANERLQQLHKEAQARVVERLPWLAGK